MQAWNVSGTQFLIEDYDLLIQISVFERQAADTACCGKVAVDWDSYSVPTEWKFAD